MSTNTNSPMKLSDLVAKMAEDIAANGDAANVTLGISVTGTDGKQYRLDVVLGDQNSVEIIRDSNYVHGMACVVAEYKGPHEIFI